MSKTLLESHFGIRPRELKYFNDCRQKPDEIIIVELKHTLSGLAAVKTALERTSEKFDLTLTPTAGRSYMLKYKQKRLVVLDQEDFNSDYKALRKRCELYFPNYLDGVRNINYLNDRGMHSLQIDFLKEFDKNLCEIFKP